jgi:hypothetical protein
MADWGQKACLNEELATTDPYPSWEIAHEVVRTEAVTRPAALNVLHRRDA